MILNVRNISDTVVTIADLSTTIMPGITVDLLNTRELHECQKSEAFLCAVGAKLLVVNNGDRDLSIVEFSKYLHNMSLNPTDVSGRPRVHQTSRPEGTITCWSACGDAMDTEDVTQIIHRGEPCIINHRVGEQDSPLYLDFSAINNITYVHEGHITFSNCNFDKIECSIVPQLVTLTEGTNTNFQRYNGIIIPAAGTGDVNIDTSHLHINFGFVQVKYDETGVKTSAGFWNVEWDEATRHFINLTPAPDGSGEYNMFYYEMIFNRFVVDYLVNAGTALYQSSDTNRLWHGMRLKVLTSTCGLDWSYEGIEDHPWQMVCRFTLHRQIAT